MADNPANPLALIGTSAAAHGFGASCAVIFLAYHHIPNSNNGIDVRMVEDALTVIFSTTCSILAMIGHILLAKFLTPKT